MIAVNRWLAVALVALAPHSAAAQLPDAATLLAEVGFSPAEIAQVEAGQLVRHDVPPASERELTAGFAFHVPLSPADLVKNSKQDLLDRVDPNMMGFAAVSTPGSAADFAKLTLQPDPAKRAQAYTSAQPGGDLNLSAEEIAAFQKLASAAPPAVEAAVRDALLARVQAYRTKGLAGLAPYALADGKTRSPGEEMRTATLASKKLEKYVPAAYQYLLSYPKGKPPGTQETLRWSQFEAHGTPTIALTQMLVIPDGDAYVVAQRQFYASTGYNAEQALAAFLPSKDGGTVVVYANRTSTDEITGIGGGTKRSLGSKVLSSQLEGLFEKARPKAQ